MPEPLVEATPAEAALAGGILDPAMLPGTAVADV